MIDFILKQIVKKLNNAKKKTKNFLAKTPDEDFTPYVCHYNPNTLLTKNGELLQVIRITGFNNKSVVSETASLREAVRETIKKNINDNRTAFWLNTIRRKKDITPKGNFAEIFDQKLDEAWVKENNWDDQFVNELYITIIVEGIDTSIVNSKSFLRSFSYMTTKSLHRNFLDNAYQRLSAITNNIINDTTSYGAKILGCQEWEGTLYSEPMRFFGKISNLNEERYPLSANDISNELSQNRTAFGNREIEVISTNDKNYAAILSLKEYFETSTTSLERILQLPFEFIITQSFDFAFDNKELEPYEYQDYILGVSGDEDLKEIIGINNFIESKKGSPTDYGKMQTTIMVISKKRNQLEEDVKSLLEKFQSLGFVVTREDIYLEHCFWSQLPANFRFLRRQKIINTDRAAGFAALHDYPSGIIAGNKWGPAITVLNTALKTPYFLNFHDNDLGHSLILGPELSGKTTLLNFLLSQSRRVSPTPKIFYFDFDDSAKCFIAANDGQYYSLLQEPHFYEQHLKLNPLTLPKNEDNKNFINQLFTKLLIKHQIEQNELDAIPKIIDNILKNNITDFSLAIEKFNCQETPNIYQALSKYKKDLTSIFDPKQDIEFSSSITAFDLGAIAKNELMLASIMNYLIYKIKNQLDGSPTIIAINKAWKVFDNPILGEQLEDLLKFMTAKNAIIIFVEDNFKRILESKISQVIKNNIATEIFLPNPKIHECYFEIFDLNQEEQQVIEAMSERKHDFLLKNSEDTIIFSLDLSPIVEFSRVLSSDELTITAMQEVIEDIKGENKNTKLTAKMWLDQLLEVLKAIEDEIIEQEKQRIKEEQAEKRRILKEKLGGNVDFD